MCLHWPGKPLSSSSERDEHATDERRHQVAKQLDSLARGQLKSGSG